MAGAVWRMHASKRSGEEQKFINAHDCWIGLGEIGGDSSDDAVLTQLIATFGNFVNGDQPGHQLRNGTVRLVNAQRPRSQFRGEGVQVVWLE